MPRWWNGIHTGLRSRSLRVRVSPWAPFYGVTLADLVRSKLASRRFNSRRRCHFCKQVKRAGVIPLEALCSDAHLLWISCRDERSLIVSGVMDYLLQDDIEFYPCVDSLQPHALAKPDCLQFLLLRRKEIKCLKFCMMEKKLKLLI